MVGSPWQTPENLADDMLFLEKLNPQMVGIGPFIPHCNTPLKDHPAGTLELTLYLLGLIRLLLPRFCCLLPLPLEPLIQEGGSLAFWQEPMW